MQKLGIYSTRTHLHADTNPGARVAVLALRGRLACMTI